MAYRKDIRRTQSSFAIGKTTENATSLKIISDDLCDRNCLKSKVSTIEELYDFLSTFCRQTQRAVFLLPFISINIFSNQLCRRQPQPPHFQDALFERQFRRKHTSVLTFPHGLLLCDRVNICVQRISDKSAEPYVSQPHCDTPIRCNCPFRYLCHYVIHFFIKVLHH